MIPSKFRISQTQDSGVLACQLLLTEILTKSLGPWLGCVQIKYNSQEAELSEKHSQMAGDLTGLQQVVQIHHLALRSTICWKRKHNCSDQLERPIGTYCARNTVGNSSTVHLRGFPSKTLVRNDVDVVCFVNMLSLHVCIHLPDMPDMCTVQCSGRRCIIMNVEGESTIFIHLRSLGGSLAQEKNMKREWCGRDMFVATLTSKRAHTRTHTHASSFDQNGINRHLW